MAELAYIPEYLPPESQRKLVALSEESKPETAPLEVSEYLIRHWCETLEDGTKRTVLRLHPRLAPVKVAVLPLVNKEGMPERALAAVGLDRVPEELRETVERMTRDTVRLHDASWSGDTAVAPIAATTFFHNNFLRH